MRRVMIIGDAGSGKSTLARWIGVQTGLRVYHLDQVFWMSNWTPRADTLIWLDLPVYLRLWRVLRRTLQYRGVNRPDMPKGCIQRFDHNRVSFVRFIWRDRHSGRKRMAACCAMADDRVVVHHLTSRRAVRAFKRVLLAK